MYPESRGLCIPGISLLQSYVLLFIALLLPCICDILLLFPLMSSYETTDHCCQKLNREEERAEAGLPGGTRREQELGEVKERKGFRVSRGPACGSRVVLSRRDRPWCVTHGVKGKHGSVTGTRPLGSENSGAGYTGRFQWSPGPKMSSGENDRQSQLAVIGRSGDTPAYCGVVRPY